MNDPNEKSTAREFWILKANIQNGDVPADDQPDFPELFIHVIEKSALDAALARIDTLKAENERLKTIVEKFKVYGATDCANNNSGYMSENCSGRVTLFIANEKCTGCDPESYDRQALKKSEA